MSEGSQSKQYRNNTLYVSRLNCETTEESLKPHFEKYGEIVDCRIQLHPRTGKSRRFGFIIYKQAYMVDKAVAAQPHNIDGREVFVQRSEPRERRQFPRLYIGGLNKSTNEESLKSHFKKWGEIIDCEIARYRRTGKSKGFGFITYKYANMVDIAVDARPHKIDGREVKAQRAERSYCKEMRTLFIVGLNITSNEDSLKSHFNKWGKIVECVVLRFPDSGISKGFGFITYECAYMVDKAQAARPHKIDGVKVKTMRRAPRVFLGTAEANVTVNTLYVKGIENDTVEKDLREYFGSYGNIVSVCVPVDKNTGKTRGFAFVEFDDYDTVDKIVFQRHHYKDRRLTVRKSNSSETIWRNNEMVGFQRSGGAGELDRYGRDGVSAGEGGAWGNGYVHGYARNLAYDYYSGSYGYDGSYSGAYGYDDSYSGAYGYDGSYSGAYGYDGSYSGAYGYDGSYSGAYGYDGSYSGAYGFDGSYSGTYGYHGSYPGAYGYDGNYSGAYGYGYSNSCTGS